MASESAKTDLCMTHNNDEEQDLEDGEIESDDEPILVQLNKNNLLNPVPTSSIKTKSKNDDPKKTVSSSTSKSSSVIIDIIDNEAHSSKLKFNRINLVEDDFAGNIENAIAAALKKDGIEPPLPKTLPKANKEDELDKKSTCSGRNRKSRKRKKKDNEREKSEERNKRSRHEEITSTQNKNEEDDIDDALMYEMLGIRGGSPPPISTLVPPSTAPNENLPIITSFFSDDSYSSYDSYDSESEYRRKGDRRYSRRNRKENKNRDRSRDRGGRDKDRSNRRKNRHGSEDGCDDRNNSICLAYLRGQCQNDDCLKKHEGRPERKLELCKFYLKECCAKKDKCLYMHADFPCKYYYLGMECIYKKECKYMHGEPLSETLRNILLKHIETAPKEILGTFRRISRDYALQSLNKQHAILCKKYNIENTLTQAMTNSQSISVMSNVGNNNNSYKDNSNNCKTTSLSENPLKHFGNNLKNESIISNVLCSGNISIHQPDNQVKLLSTSNLTSTSGIPSLLDMYIPSPTGFNENDISTLASNMKVTIHDNNKPRKSRWTDTNAIQLQQTNASSASNIISSNNTNINNMDGKKSDGNTAEVVPNFLKLQYLNGILRQDQIEKLIQLGVETLQQLTTLSLMQLNSVGLTVNQLNEIQLNTMNLEKLGIFKMDAANSSQPINSNKQTMDTKVDVKKQTFGGYLNDHSKEVKTHFIIDAMKASTNDIDMRVLPSDDRTAITTSCKDQEKSKAMLEVGSCIASPEPQLNEIVLSPKCISEFKKTERCHNNLNTVDYSQYLKDSNLGSDKMDMIDDEKYEDHNLVLEEDEDQLKIDESAFDFDNEKSNTSSKDGRSTPVGEQNFDDNSDSSSILLPPVFSTFDQIKSKKVIDLSSTVSSLMKAQAAVKAAAQSSENLNSLKAQSGTSYFQNNHSESKDNENNFVPELHKDASNIENHCDNFLEKKNQDLLAVNSFYGSIDTKTLTDNNDFKVTLNNQNEILGENMAYDIKNFFTKSKLIDKVRSPSPVRSPQYRELTSYDRPSIYDGNLNEDCDESNKDSILKNSSDKDMRVSEYIDSGDLDFRLPFKPVTNFKPATEIDGSIASNNSIIYRVAEIFISKPNYKDIRRNFQVNEKTLDPRLRRIFCINDESASSSYSLSTNQATFYESDSESSHSSLQSSLTPIPSTCVEIASHLKEMQQEISSSTLSSIIITGPAISSDPRAARLDPRKRNTDNNTVLLSSSSSTPGTQLASTSQTNPLPVQQNNDIRMILQKSSWYKNLNSKYKIMINQQLAMVSTELKKFHQNPSANKIFDITFIMQNPTLQQILTNLCIYIDDNGIIRQIDSDSESSDSGNGNNLGNKTKNSNQINVITNNNNNTNNINSNISRNSNTNNSCNMPINSSSLANSILGFPNLLEFNANNNAGIQLAGGQQQQSKHSNKLIGLGNLLDIPNINNNALDFLRGPPPLHVIQQQQHQLQRYSSIAAVINNQFNNQQNNPFSSTGDLRPGLLGVAPGMAFNNQFGNMGIPRADLLENNNIMPLVSNDSLLGNSQYPSGGSGNGNFSNFFNDPRNRNMNQKNINNSNNSKRFNNFGMNSNNNSNNSNNSRDRRNFNDNRTNRDNNRNRDKRKI